MVWQVQVSTFVLSAGFFLRSFSASSSPLQAAYKHFGRDYAAMNLLQIKSDMCKLKSISSIGLD